MYVVGHQAVGVHRATVLSCEVLEHAQVQGVILWPEKAGAPVVAPMPHVECHAGNDESGGSGHPYPERAMLGPVDAQMRKMGTVPI